MLRPTTALAVLALTLAAACTPAPDSPAAPTAGPTAASTAPGPSAPGPSASGPSASAGTAGQLVGRGTVIGEGKQTRLCAEVLRSDPPECGAGVELVGWRWPEQGFERQNLTTWGDFAVVGSYDGRRLRVTRTVDPSTLPPPRNEQPDLTSPCPEPAGGWRAPEPARATYDTQDQALQLAEGRPGFADAWIDDRGNADQDPTEIVLNFRFTEDLAGAEQAIRQVWGGALCVSPAERTRAEVTKIQRELQATPGWLASGGDLDQVEIMVAVDDGALQRRVDERYGAGVVRVTSFLSPYVE